MHTDYKKVEINSDELVELKAIEHDLKSRFVVFQFLSNNVPINLNSCTVRAYALNSKKNEIFNNLKIIDASRGKAELELTDAFLKRGTTIYQLKIYGAKGEKLSSNIFSLNVGEDLMRDNSIESTNEFNALEEALNEVKGFEEVKREILDLKNLLAETITRMNTTNNIYNIVSNGSFYGDGRCWECTGNFWSGTYDGYGFNKRGCASIRNTQVANNDASEKYLQTYKAYRVKKHTKYTLNLHYAVERNVHSMDVFVILSHLENREYGSALKAITAVGGQQTDARNEVPFTYTFDTGEFEWVWIRIDHNGMKNNANVEEFCFVYISEVAIYEGDVGVVKWTPKPGEIYSTNVQADDMGIKVKES